MRRALSLWLPLAALAVFLLFPFYWMVLTSIKPNEELVSVTANPFWVAHPTLDHLTYLLSATSYPRWFWNTMAVASAATALSVSVSFLAAFALARLRFRGAEGVSLGIYLAYLIPPAILFIPLAEVMLKLGWFDQLWALVPVYSTFLVPFCTWLLLGYFRTIPQEIEECAMVDGCTRFQALIRIVLPVAVPGIVCAVLFAFTISWNEFIYALTFISSTAQKTTSVGVTAELIRGDIFYWGSLMAGAVLGSVPIVLVYVVFMDYYVSGLTQGAIK